MTKNTRCKRYVAGIVAAAVLAGAAATVFAVSYPTTHDTIQSAFNSDSEADRQTAQQIADMTGASVYQLLEMKASMGSWNHVLSSIEKNGMDYQDLTDDELEAMTNKFPEEELKQVSELIARVVFQLQEINARVETASQPETLPSPGISGGTVNTEHDFEKLEGQFLRNRAIWLVLEMQQQYGSFEKALDEYLYSLQVEVEFELALTDFEEYEKQIVQKGSQLLRENAITVLVIEQRMLELLSKDQARQEEAMDTLSPESDDVKMPENPKIEKAEPEAQNPKNILPGEGHDPVPAKPAAEVYEEIEKIKQNSRPGAIQIGGDIQ